jgi:hypothetical protein
VICFSFLVVMHRVVFEPITSLLRQCKTACTVGDAANCTLHQGIMTYQTKGDEMGNAMNAEHLGERIRNAHKICWKI